MRASNSFYVSMLDVEKLRNLMPPPGLREIVTAGPAGRAITEDGCARFDDRDAVWRALLTLAPRRRAVIVLRYYEDLSELEIAAVMGTSPGTVKSQSARLAEISVACPACCR